MATGGKWTSPPGWPGVQIKAQAIKGRNTIVGVRIEKAEGLTTEDLRSIPLGAIEILLNTRPENLEEAVENVLRHMENPPTPQELRLPKTPEPGKKPDYFYMQVATLYQRLAFHRMRPAVELAAVNKVPVTTVHRWIREARRRGFLPPVGRKGRSG